MKADDRKKIINDIILIVFLCVVAAMACLFLYGRDNSEDKIQLQIVVDGELVDTYEYSEDEYTYKRISIDTGNIVVIDEGKVYMESANCPDGLCIKQGKISMSGQSIICLPHKLVVRLVDISDEEYKGYEDEEDITADEGLDVMPR